MQPRHTTQHPVNIKDWCADSVRRAMSPMDGKITHSIIFFCVKRRHFDERPVATVSSGCNTQYMAHAVADQLIDTQ